MVYHTEWHALKLIVIHIGMILLYVKSQHPFKISFKLKLCSFASVRLGSKVYSREKSTLLILSALNDLL